VKKNASHQEIADAFRNLSLQYHPKNQPMDKETEKKFTEVCDAYNHLHDEYKRRHYDRIISGD
jgi:DnaJ-class molecular chaperone